MRSELQQIQQIEQYLSGQLSAEDLAAFENLLASDPTLREKVELQRGIHNGLDRIHWKSQIRGARRSFHQKRIGWRWGGGLGLALLTTVGFLLFNSPKAAHSIRLFHNDKTATPTASDTPILSPIKTSTAVDSSSVFAPTILPPVTNPSDPIPAQIFTIYTTRDTILSSAEGLTLSIPANAFLESNGRLAKGPVQLLLREALNAEDILKAGLSTRSGDQPLETAGMFLIDAKEDGRLLTLNPQTTLYADVPANAIKPGMMLYTGVKKADSTIDWINPKPLEHNLVCVDINMLNFYPPHYLDSIRQRGYNDHDKRFTDSLYYSFAQYFGSGTIYRSKVAQQEYSPRIALKSDTFIEPRRDSVTSPRRNSVGWFPHSCGLNPASIKTIWTEKFQHTLLATHEFEERLYWLHKCGDQSLLDLYINHLDCNLYELDSMVVAKTTNGDMHALFLSFQARRDGKVKAGSRQFQELSDYYNKKTKEITNAIAQEQQAYRDKMQTLERLSEEKHDIHSQDSVNRAQQQLYEEYNYNLNRVAKKLGYHPKQPMPGQTVYRAPITILGWCNVDRQVYLATQNRRPTRIINQENGKTYTLRYSPANFHILDPQNYDHIAVYLLPNKLSTFMRITGSHGNFSEWLNDFFHYDLVCIAYKNEQAYYYIQSDIEAGDYSLGLIPISAAQLDERLNDLHRTDLIEDNHFTRWEVADQKRHEQYMSVVRLHQQLRKWLFPCLIDDLPEPVIIRETPTYK